MTCKGTIHCGRPSSERVREHSIAANVLSNFPPLLTQLVKLDEPMGDQRRISTASERESGKAFRQERAMTEHEGAQEAFHEI
jgi:hypothetical protein